MWICLDCHAHLLSLDPEHFQLYSVLSMVTTYPPSTLGSGWLSLYQSAAEPVSNLVTTDTQNLRVGKPKHLVVQLQN